MEFIPDMCKVMCFGRLDNGKSGNYRALTKQLRPQIHEQSSRSRYDTEEGLSDLCFHQLWHEIEEKQCDIITLRIICLGHTWNILCSAVCYTIGRK